MSDVVLFQIWFWVGVAVSLFSSYFLLRACDDCYSFPNMIMSGLAGLVFGIAWPLALVGIIAGLPAYGLVKLAKAITTLTGGVRHG